jgi:ParB-like chromosome segregation protein Spo0J
MSSILDDAFEGGPTKIPVDSCVVSGDPIDPNDKLISAIKRTKGIIHPIIVEHLENGKYYVVIGKRRVLAYRILKKEDSEYEEIRAYVSKGKLTGEQKKAISFEEGMRQRPIDKIDYVDVIEYIYEKNGKSLKNTAHELGLTVAEVKKYLTHARLSDKVKKCIEDKEFTIDTAMKALQALGEDEESVDDDFLIELAKELTKVPPMRRKEIVKEMNKNHITFDEAVEKVYSIKTQTIKFEVEVIDEIMKRFERIADEKGYDSVEDLIVDLIQRRLLKDDEE